eukprot:COSAG01_NODE_1798_length_9184_cov_6.067860_15_plen_62_part_00
MSSMCSLTCARNLRSASASRSRSCVASWFASAQRAASRLRSLSCSLESRSRCRAAHKGAVS